MSEDVAHTILSVAVNRDTEQLFIHLIISFLLLIHQFIIAAEGANKVHCLTGILQEAETVISYTRISVSLLSPHLMSLNLLAVSEHSASQQTAMQPTSAVWRQASSVTAVQSSPSEREPT